MKWNRPLLEGLFQDLGHIIIIRQLYSAHFGMHNGGGYIFSIIKGIIIKKNNQKKKKQIKNPKKSKK